MYPEDLKDPPSWKGEPTCMTQGCLGPQNDASFEGPMILRVNEQKKTALARKDEGYLLKPGDSFEVNWKSNPGMVVEKTTRLNKIGSFRVRNFGRKHIQNL